MSTNYSPMRLGTLIAGVASTAAIAFGIIAETASGYHLIPDDLGRALWAITILAWFAHIDVAYRDTILNQIDARMDRLTDDLSEYGDRRETDGQLAGMRRASEPATKRPHLIQ